MLLLLLPLTDEISANELILLHFVILIIVRRNVVMSKTYKEWTVDCKSTGTSRTIRVGKTEKKNWTPHAMVFVQK